MGQTMKLMKHPLHGFHNATSPNEEAALRLTGWLDDIKEAPQEKPVDPIVEMKKKRK